MQLSIQNYNKFNNYTHNIFQAQKSNSTAPNLERSPKADTISFQAYKPDLMSLPAQKIIKECQRALADGIVIGEGQEAICYKMERFPQYCIRRDKKTSADASKFGLSYALSKFDKVNHVVAKLDDGTVIEEYISGIPLKIIPHRDTPDGILVKKSIKGLIANNFPEAPFRKILEQIESAQRSGIKFDRNGENLLVDAVNQEFNCIDFSPRFQSEVVEYNPISFIYSAIDVDNTEHAPKIFGKLCKAYAQRILSVDIKRLNLDTLDLNFYHRGFINDPFNDFPNKKLLDEVSEKLRELIEIKKDKSNPKEYLEYMVYEFKEFINEKIMPCKKQSMIPNIYD